MNFPRGSYYRYKKNKNRKKQETVDQITSTIIEIFQESKGNYGLRRIKVELKNRGFVVSRRRIRRIMKENFLFSSYQESQFKVYPKSSDHNKEDVENMVDKKFTNREYREVLISDLTYLNVNNRTAYLCVISDLFNREILGYSTGFTKTPGLVIKAFSCIKDLSNVKYFHTDRDCEFKNGEIDRLLFENGIRRSLSRPEVPYDNACTETIYKTIKIEFVKKRKFKNMDELNLEFFNYMVWYNFKRLHSSLDYLSPVQYKLNRLGVVQ